MRVVLDTLRGFAKFQLLVVTIAHDMISRAERLPTHIDKSGLDSGNASHVLRLSPDHGT
jgi:hypothetical protein